MSNRERDSSQRIKEDYYMLMLKVNPEKEVVPVKWSASSLNEDSAALIIDEQSERLYLWLGERVDAITKAIARRRSADVSSQGYKLQNVSYPIGKIGTKKLEVVEINQADLAKEPQIKNAYAELKTLFRKKTELLEGDILARATVKVPAAMRELGTFTRAPPQFQEVSKTIEEKFGRAPEIFAERETMRERYKEREHDKIGAVYALAFVEVLGGKANLEIKRQDQRRLYQVSKEKPAETPLPLEAVEAPQAPEADKTAEVKRCSFIIEDNKLRILESNMTQDEVNKVMRKVEELTL